MKNILVPTDFSDCAMHATKSAISIAKLAKAQVHFLHLLSIPHEWVYANAKESKLYPDVNQKVEEASDRLKSLVKKAENAGLIACLHVGFSDDKKTIHEYTSQHDIDLIVMGSHGASGMKELLVGSNAQKVIRYAKVPVVVVKKEISSIIGANLAFVSDFEAEATVPFQKVLKIADLIQAKIHLLYINTPAFFNDTWEIKSKMESFKAMASSRLTKSSICDDFIFEEGVQKYCDHLKIDIVALATHGRKGFSRVLLGNDAEKVVNHLKQPVITLQF